MAWSIRQTVIGAAAFTLDVVQGNVLIAGMRATAGLTLTATDTVGSTWTVDNHDVDGSVGSAFGYAIAAASGANTVTFGGGSPDILILHEFENPGFSGVFLGSDWESGAAGNPLTASFSVTAGGLTVASIASNGPATFTKGATYTLGAEDAASPNCRLATEWKEPAADGTDTAGATYTTPWHIYAASFSAVAAAGASMRRVGGARLRHWSARVDPFEILD